MARKAKELTALEVGRLTKPGLWAVGVVAGLYLHVSDKDSRSWILRVTVGGKRRDMGLGGFPDVTLAQAREKARDARLKIEQGVDPILARKQLRSTLIAAQATEMTFSQCAAAYIDAHGDTWRNPKHRQQWANTLETYAAPVIGKMLVQDVGQTQVMAILEPIWKTKTETAVRVRGRIETVLDWATVRKHRSGENPARWKGHLDKLLPKPSKVSKVEHHPAVPIDDVAGFMSKLGVMAGTSPSALEFVILMAARSGEVRGATWAEVDLKNKVWTVPAERMKSGKEHRKPLSKEALALLSSQPQGSQNDLIFQAPRGGELSDMALTAVMRRMKVEAVPHGFRSTFRDWAAERTTYPRELAEQALAHSIEDKVEEAYRRGDMLEKRRAMMQAWADFCGAVMD